jgi:hypothetical protein
MRQRDHSSYGDRGRDESQNQNNRPEAPRKRRCLLSFFGEIIRIQHEAPTS